MTADTTGFWELMKRPLWQVGVAALVVAAIAAEIYRAVVGLVVDFEAVPFGGDEVEKIGFGGFATAVVFYGVIGILVSLGIAKWVRPEPARAWTIVAVAGTVLSFGSPLFASDIGAGTKIGLALGHVLVAAIMIPVIALRLNQIAKNA